ncbi:hypothetical protein [Nonomuraea typhae]|uniref:hypothetical protein n=1 Tax=Nonomuraea typhae TaxID=2603600 RepID=UPI0012FA9D4F|nr:hypothetical protein [Nonomuraea typhae]
MPAFHPIVRDPPWSWMNDDDQLLLMLVTTWALCSGRIPLRLPMDAHTEAELIAFWADDLTANPPCAPPPPKPPAPKPPPPSPAPPKPHRSRRRDVVGTP